MAAGPGAGAFEFEPYWYFFQFVRPAGTRNNYDTYPSDKRGDPTDNFRILIAALDRALGF
jgi:hypothetical protein